MHSVLTCGGRNRFANLPEEVKDKYSLAKAYYSFGWSHGKENLQGKPDFSKGSYYNNPETNDVTNGNQELIDKFPAFYHPNIWPEGASAHGKEDRPRRFLLTVVCVVQRSPRLSRPS